MQTVVINVCTGSLLFTTFIVSIAFACLSSLTSLSHPVEEDYHWFQVLNMRSCKSRLRDKQNDKQLICGFVGNKLKEVQIGVNVSRVHILASVSQWIECQSVNQRVAGSIPSQGMCLGCRPCPQYGALKRQPHINVSFPLFLLPLASLKINK